ncbi:MAG: hypothetical protein ACK5O2_12840 [Microthrixaceae bacterium]
MISKLLIVGLVLLWAAVLVPDFVRRLSTGRRSDTIRSFNTQLSSLGRSAPVQRIDNVIDLRSHRKPAGGGHSRQATQQRLATRQRQATQQPLGAPRPASMAVRKRRQDVLVALGAAALVTLLATVAFGGVFLYLQLLCDVALAAYLVALQQVGASRPVHSPARNTGGIHPIGAMSVTQAVQPRAVEPRRIAN